MTNPPRRTKTVVGVITVHVDGRGNPYRFTREDGTDAGCVCQASGARTTCGPWPRRPVRHAPGKKTVGPASAPTPADRPRPAGLGRPRS